MLVSYSSHFYIQATSVWLFIYCFQISKSVHVATAMTIIIFVKHDSGLRRRIYQITSIVGLIDFHLISHWG